MAKNAAEAPDRAENSISAPLPENKAMPPMAVKLSASAINRLLRAEKFVQKTASGIARAATARLGMAPKVPRKSRV